jgi:hypothetical protein
VTGANLCLEVLVRRKWRQTVAALRDLTESDPVARRVAVGAHVGPIKNALGYPCYPAGVAQAQISEVVMKYLRNNPERLNDPARLLVLNGPFPAAA